MLVHLLVGQSVGNSFALLPFYRQFLHQIPCLIACDYFCCVSAFYNYYYHTNNNRNKNKNKNKKTNNSSNNNNNTSNTS